MTQRRALHPDGLVRTRGSWSHTVVVSAINTLVFVAGQTALDAEGSLVGAGDFNAQFDKAYQNLRVALRASGADFSTLVSLRTYLTRAEDVEAFVKLRDELHKDVFPAGDYPPNTLVVVERLAVPGLLIEIEAIAAT